MSPTQAPAPSGHRDGYRASMAAPSSMAVDLELDALKKEMAALKLELDVGRMKHSSHEGELGRLVLENSDLRAQLEALTNSFAKLKMMVDTDARVVAQASPAKRPGSTGLMSFIRGRGHQRSQSTDTSLSSAQPSRTTSPVQAKTATSPENSKPARPDTADEQQS